jgi:hypothetical protein
MRPAADPRLTRGRAEAVAGIESFEAASKDDARELLQLNQKL